MQTGIELLHTPGQTALQVVVLLPTRAKPGLHEKARTAFSAPGEVSDIVPFSGALRPAHWLAEQVGAALHAPVARHVIVVFPQPEPQLRVTFVP